MEEEDIKPDVTNLNASTSVTNNKFRSDVDIKFDKDIVIKNENVDYDDQYELTISNEKIEFPSIDDCKDRIKINSTDDTNLHNCEERLKCNQCNEIFHQNYQFAAHLANCNTLTVNEKDFNDQHKDLSQEKTFKVNVHDKRKSKNIELLTQQGLSSDVNNEVFSPNDFHRQERIHSCKKSYSCDVCDKIFSRRSHLNAHKMIHTGEKPFNCEVCFKAFSDKSNLYSHRRIHTGEKPYSCDMCEKSFCNKSNLYRHKRIHSGVKPYSCDVCGKAFPQRCDLNRHKKIHNGEKSFSDDL